MKTLVRFLLAAVLMPLASCNRKTGDNEQEIERRVQARLAEERRVEQERTLQEKEQALAGREKSLSAREEDIERKRAEAEAAANAQRSEPSGDSPRGAAQPVGEQSYDLFYRELQPDGEWIETDRYGYVWRPAVALREPDWRPYADGHWVYTDYGWTWVSNERFGWAVYHYGRWVRIARFGWVWAPGDEWAPAWVSWRYGDDYVGWAALPPEARWDRGAGFDESVESVYGLGATNYIFVETVNFCAPRLREIIIAPVQNVMILNRTRNVTHISYNNSMIVNRGPGVDVIASRARHPVQRLKVDRVSAAGGAATVKSGRLEIPAPIIKKAAAPAAKPHVTQRVTGVQVEHAEANAPQLAAPVASPNPKVAPQQPAPQQVEAESKSRDTAAQQQAEENRARQMAAQQKAEAERKAREMAAQQQAEAERKTREMAEQRQKFELEQQKRTADEAMKAQRAFQAQQEEKARAEAEAAKHQAEAQRKLMEEQQRRANELQKQAEEKQKRMEEPSNKQRDDNRKGGQPPAVQPEKIEQKGQRDTDKNDKKQL